MKIETTSFATKVLIVLTLSFCTKLLFSCDPTLETIEINYDAAEVMGIDNSARYLANHIDVDTLYAEAVALRVTVSDTSNHYAENFPTKWQPFSFQPLHAWDYQPVFAPKAKVLAITVKTLVDINETLKAGSDVSDYVLYAPESFGGLYKRLNYGLSRLNGTQSTRDSSIDLVLKTPVENTHAQFEITITLDNGTSLLASTPLFTILKQ
jgi:hypothetical protein